MAKIRVKARSPHALAVGNSLGKVMLFRSVAGVVPALPKRKKGV